MPISPPLGRADLHVHPSGDSGTAETVEAMYAALCASGLQVAVLADHDRLDVAQTLVARARAERQRIELVVGEEISTSEGHLLGINLRERIAPGLSMVAAIAAVHRQGGLAVVAHPLLPIRVSTPADLLAELYEGDRRFRPDGLEAMNTRAARLPGWRGRVERLAARYDYALTGGSDAHAPRAVGSGWTEFPGTDAADLYAALRGRQTRPAGRPQSLGHIARGTLAQFTGGSRSRPQ